MSVNQDAYNDLRAELESAGETIEKLTASYNDLVTEHERTLEELRRAVGENTDLDGALGQQDGESLLDAALRVTGELSALRLEMAASREAPVSSLPSIRENEERPSGLRSVQVPFEEPK